MNKNYNDLLNETVSEVFETIAFMLPMEVDIDSDNPEASQDNIMTIGISFEGFASGELIISFPGELAKLVAANILGVDEDDPDVEAKSIDASKELLNIICGNLLPKLYGDEPVFNLHAPYLIDKFNSEISVKDSENLSQIKLEVEDFIVSCWLLLT